MAVQNNVKNNNFALYEELDEFVCRMVREFATTSNTTDPTYTTILQNYDFTVTYADQAVNLINANNTVTTNNPDCLITLYRLDNDTRNTNWALFQNNPLSIWTQVYQLNFKMAYTNNSGFQIKQIRNEITKLLTNNEYIYTATLSETGFSGSTYKSNCLKNEVSNLPLDVSAIFQTGSSNITSYTEAATTIIFTIYK
jgi:hypothetical protein